MRTLPSLLVVLCAASLGNAGAQVVVTVTQGEETGLAATYDSTDLIQGLIPVELPGDRGWHSVNTDPMDQLPAFTDGQGDRGNGLTGLLNDFPGAGLPAKLIEYALAVPSDIHEIRVFSGNNNRDGRVFHTYTIRFSSDWGQTFTAPIYVQSHISGTLNNAEHNQWRAVLSQLTSGTSALATEVTHIELDFYAVDNTQGQMRDAFDGTNPFTVTDDALTAAITSPLIWEIDVLGTESAPRISAHRSGPALELTWLSQKTSFFVQSASQLSSPDWEDLTPQPAIQRDGVTNRTSVAIGDTPKLFRIRIPQ